MYESDLSKASFQKICTGLILLHYIKWMIPMIHKQKPVLLWKFALAERPCSGVWVPTTFLDHSKPCASSCDQDKKDFCHHTLWYSHVRNHRIILV